MELKKTWKNDKQKMTKNKTWRIAQYDLEYMH